MSGRTEWFDLAGGGDTGSCPPATAALMISLFKGALSERTRLFNFKNRANCRALLEFEQKQSSTKNFQV